MVVFMGVCVVCEGGADTNLGYSFVTRARAHDRAPTDIRTNVYTIYRVIL